MELADSSRGKGVQVICAGLVRTGLQSLHLALQDVGFKTFYDRDRLLQDYKSWNDVVEGKATPDVYRSILGDTDVVLGLPVCCFWEQILECYPNARVILTLRNEDAWFNSVKQIREQSIGGGPAAPLRHGSAMQTIERWMVPSYHQLCEVLRVNWQMILGVHALDGKELDEFTTRQTFRKHNAYVQSRLSGCKVGNRPQLLVYSGEEGWGPLCDFLGVEVPDKKFPAAYDVPHLSTTLYGVNNRRSHVVDTHQIGDLVENSAFISSMRTELWWRLLLVFLTLTILVIPFFLLHFGQFAKVPFLVIAFIYGVLLQILWNVYVILNDVVARVPAVVIFPTVIKSILIASLINAIYITYGVLKELLVTQYRIASPVLVLATRSSAVIAGICALKITKQPLQLGAPLPSFGAFALTNEIATWAGYEMLKYVSFPVQVMAKSCKLLPNMLMGRLINNTKHSFGQYLQAVVVLVCVVMVQFDSSGSNQAKHKHKNIDTGSSTYMTALMGIILSCVFFASDSFTPQWQTKLFTSYPDLTQVHMMLGGNLFGLGITCTFLVSQWTDVSESFWVVWNRTDVLLCTLGLAFCGAMGQFCIYYAIRTLGPLSFSWIMTTRQLLSVLISLVWFGHGVSLMKIGCIATVFIIMSSRELKRGSQAVLRVSNIRYRVRRLSGGMFFADSKKTQ